MVKWGTANADLYKASLIHMSIMLELILQTTDVKKITRKHRDKLCEIWKLPKLHQRSSATNVNITTTLSQELAKMKVTDFDCPTKYLDAFDSKLEKFNEISLDVLPTSISTTFLKSAAYGNIDLLSAWGACETIR